MAADEDADYELVMPFVVVRSTGGPYDDEAYCAGMELGRLDRDLLTMCTWVDTFETLIRVANAPHVDLVAMQYGWAMDHDPEHDADGWVTVTLRRSKGEDHE
jgi:hypothetical protein